MDDITGSMKDIYSTIKERLTNPFIFSFIIAWFLWNWKITIGLVFYSAKNLKSLGPASYWDLITNNSDLNSNLILPGISAIGYTFLFPLIRLGINSFNAWVDRRDQDNVMKISGTGSIPTIKYLELQKTYDSYIKELSEIIQTEGQVKQENIELNSDLTASKQEVNRLTETVAELKKITNVTSLSGSWYVRIEPEYLKRKDGTIITDQILNIGNFDWRIDDTIISENRDALPHYQEYIIHSYVCNPFNRKVVLTIRFFFTENNRDKHTTEVLPELTWTEDLKALYGKGIKISKGKIEE